MLPHRGAETTPDARCDGDDNRGDPCEDEECASLETKDSRFVWYGPCPYRAAEALARDVWLGDGFLVVVAAVSDLECAVSLADGSSAVAHGREVVVGYAHRARWHQNESRRVRADGVGKRGPPATVGEKSRAILSWGV